MSGLHRGTSSFAGIGPTATCLEAAVLMTTCDRIFYNPFTNAAYKTVVQPLGAAMAENDNRSLSDRRVVQDRRRSGVDARSDEEKRSIGERRSNKNRRSKVDLRSNSTSRVPR